MLILFSEMQQTTVQHTMHQSFYNPLNIIINPGMTINLSHLKHASKDDAI